ncbi:gas vesicle protein GvpL/GvpF [Lentzea atacamensis]|uniref:Gas vesicle protein GvpL/GvpF n=1 Tax=Lentzea atacamensis TaxID=531938 RepID=A0A316I4C5_9PSEU|nr:GvpL/GvpF family gas vesicle protein [Lentzea atacamensis]PWK87267.1 gas vesicle protein GvpL/GvpF [Lentzea atacamensis]RAS70030.1 gas vesicle protein GvpL/GvpF [Lentzea atacamensis]
MSRGLYAYAITRDRQLDLAGPWLIGHRGLALVVAEVELDRFTGLELDEPTEDSPLAVLARYHDAVVRAVFQREPVLPLRFGTVLDGVDAAVRLLSARHEEASAWLDRVEGRREWGVRVRAPEREPINLDEMSGTAYLTLRRQRLNATDAVRSGAAAVHRALEQRAAESTCRDLSGDLLLEAAYLVRTEDEEDFHAEVRRLTGELGLRVEITGPWPPYSFTKVEFADA